jgi:hypothetical protein
MRVIVPVAAGLVLLALAAGDLSAAGKPAMWKTAVERTDKVPDATREARYGRASDDPLAELRAEGWVTYDEAIARGLPWVKPEKLMGRMRWCTREELNLDYAGDGPPPAPDAPVCQMHHADSGAMVPGTRALCDEMRAKWGHSASIPLG